MQAWAYDGPFLHVDVCFGKVCLGCESLDKGSGKSETNLNVMHRFCMCFCGKILPKRDHRFDACIKTKLTPLQPNFPREEPVRRKLPEKNQGGFYNMIQPPKLRKKPGKTQLFIRTEKKTPVVFGGSSSNPSVVKIASKLS